MDATNHRSDWRATHFFAILLALPVAAASAGEPMFPFVVAYDNPENVTNLSAWLDAPAGKHGHIRALDGHFQHRGGPIRFWGTNLCFDACFPEREQAVRLADRLARLGINCVRMHHMDSRSIWGDSPNHVTIDPKQIERLDYLIFQLKQRGIYTNLNLHVSRWFGPKEGFPEPSDGQPKYDKGLDNFEPRMIDLQKKFARDLLTHVNVFTGNAYCDEPAIAMVEINNENALFNEWSRGHLDALPEPYATTLRRKWNAWLTRKYRDTDTLKKAWNVRAVPLGEELLSTPRFAPPLAKEWIFEGDDQTQFEKSVQLDGPARQPYLRVVVTKQGEQAWRPQFSQAGVAIQKGRPYTLQFIGRADTTRPIGVNCMMAHEPWQRLGLSATVDLSSQWQPHRLTFVAEKDDQNARITFTGLKPGVYEFAQPSLRTGGITGLEPNEILEDQTVPVLLRSQGGKAPEVNRDFIDFLWDTEATYWLPMYRYLKDDLKVQTPISGTQLSYSPVHIQSRLDYIDAHAYWQHPRFPGRPWDPNNWFVNDLAMVNQPGGTLTSLASRRVDGMPFTISEYNHPDPITFAAEGFPMIAAFGAFQAWDGIFSFSYSHNQDYEPRKLSGYFDVKGHPAKLVHMPVCHAMFVRGDVRRARITKTARMDAGTERRILHKTGDPWLLTTEQAGLGTNDPLVHRVALDISSKIAAGDTTNKTTPLPSPAATVFDVDTGEIQWDASRDGKGFFLVDTPRSKLFTGYVDDRTFEMDGVKLQIGSTMRDWATVSLVCIDGDGFDKPGRILVAASGLVRNSDARPEQLGDDRITLRSNWGGAPLLCEGIPMAITLLPPASKVSVYCLDQAGNRGVSVPVKPAGDRARINLSAEYKTLWYEIVVE